MSYAQILNLDEKQVFHNDINGEFFSVNYLPEILSLGKHYFTISIKESSGNLFLKNNS